MTAPHDIASNGDNAASDDPPLSLCARTSPAGSTAGAQAVSPDPAGAFWQSLNAEEDRRVWAMRGDGEDFATIRDAIERRRKRKETFRKASLVRWAREYRVQYRQERGL